MLSSSSEYIKALREGKYLLFLEWTDFLINKYNKDADADDTANFLIFEWLNSGYTEEDAKKLAILYAVYDLESKPLQGKLNYSLKAITVALFLCMVFQKNELSMQFYSKKQVTASEINQLMQQNITILDSFLYDESLNSMQTQFFQWVEDANKKEVDAVFQKINPITKPRYLLEDYILHLERVKINHDELYFARISIAKRFLSYLYEQTELTPEVSEEIATYVTAIREMHPSKGEEARLDSISPPSALENTWRWVTGVGMGFFSVVLQEKSIGDLISGVSQKQKF